MIGSIANNHSLHQAYIYINQEGLLKNFLLHYASVI